MNYNKKIYNEFLDRFAELRHEQWIFWSKEIAKTENISKERLARWEKLWIPFQKLSKEFKDEDRKFAENDMNIAEEYSRIM